VPLLGLDLGLGASSVRLVELGRDAKGGLTLECCVVEPLEPRSIIDGHVERFDEVARAMRRVVCKCGVRARNAALTLSPSVVITRIRVLRDRELLYECDQAFGGDLPVDDGLDALAPLVASLAREIARAPRFFFTSMSYHRVDQMLLAGALASLPGPVGVVTRQTSFSCRLVDPFDGVGIGCGVRLRQVRREAQA
jgi:type IV pilus assembly protein PilM